MITIRVKNGNVDGALKIMKKQMLEQGTLRELRERSYYKGPGQKKREKSIRARKRNSKANRDN